jgi:hypothetical protein
MVSDDYVSFETAKLLKEKGFDAECHSHYYPCRYPDGSIQYHKYERTESAKNKSWYDIYSLKNLPADHYLAPTLQMAMKWLREAHHLEIYLEHDAIQENNNWWYSIGKYTKGCISIQFESKSEFVSYEQACEAAIKYCLENLI